MINDANPIKRLVEKYLLAVPFMKNGDVIVDVACNDGTQMAWIKNYIKKEKGIEINVIGIDPIPVEGKYIEQFEKFICSKIHKVKDNITADMLISFGVPLDSSESKASYLKMADLLKPDGIAVVDVRTIGDISKATKEDITYINKDNHNKEEYLFEKYHTLYRKIMTREELVKHAYHKSYYGNMVKECNHGNTIWKENNMDFLNQK